MPLSIAITSTVAAILALVVLAGLFVRQRADACISFSIYLLSVAVGRALVVAVPQHFWNWNYWLVTDVIQTLIRLAIPFEMAFKTYRSLPEGYRRLRAIMLGLAVAIALTVAAFPGPLGSAYRWTLVCARVSYGTLFLLLAYLFFSRYHRVPIDPVFRDVTVGFTYLVTMAAFTDALARIDAMIGWRQDLLVAMTYPLLLAWWAWHMWAPEEPTGLSLESMRILQPWRVKRVKWTS